MQLLIEKEIQEIVDRETQAWNEKSTTLLLSVFHPDMVWVWPTDPSNHDPLTWTSINGKFDRARWTKSYDEWFAKFRLIHNRRATQKIFVTKEGDGAFAVVDVDTLWRADSGEESHWLGRTCKTYCMTYCKTHSKTDPNLNGETNSEAHYARDTGWKMISQTGVLQYPEAPSP